MELKKWLELPLSTLSFVLGFCLVAVSAAGGGEFGPLKLPTIAGGGQYFLIAFGLVVCATGLLLGIDALSTDQLTVDLKGILGDGAKDLKYDFKDLKTVDGLIDDIYQHLQAKVTGRSYGTQWILTGKTGDKFYDIGSLWAERNGKPPKPGLGVPIDERLVRELFSPGTLLKVQRLEKCPSAPPADRQEHPQAFSKEDYGVVITYPVDKVEAHLQDGKSCFVVKGMYKNLPRDTEIWVLVKDDVQDKWVPHGPARANEGSWEIEVLPEKNGRLELHVFVVGNDGQVLLNYYNLVSHRLEKKQLGDAPSLKKLTADFVPTASSPRWLSVTGVVVRPANEVLEKTDGTPKRTLEIRLENLIAEGDRLLKAHDMFRSAGTGGERKGYEAWLIRAEQLGTEIPGSWGIYRSRLANAIGPDPSQGEPYEKVEAVNPILKQILGEYK